MYRIRFMCRSFSRHKSTLGHEVGLRLKGLAAHLHLSAVRCAKALLSWLNRRQLLSFGKSVSSAGVLVMIVGSGKEAVRAFRGYIPQKLCCTDSSARGMGEDRR